MNTKVDEGKLISGKEALIALANGETLEMTDSEVDMPWTEICVKSNDFFGKVEPCPWMFVNTPEHIQFRLKPRTISINGIEVPAPFEPKNGEDFYYLDCTSDNYSGWAKTSWRNVESDSFKNNTVFGAWRTEEEIKQVISALRFVLNGGWHEH